MYQLKKLKQYNSENALSFQNVFDKLIFGAVQRGKANIELKIKDIIIM